MIGIIQGRLTVPWNGQLQCFPRQDWEAEFERAKDCGLDAIEPFVEVEYNDANPVWSEEGRRRLSQLSRETGIAIPTLCADCFMGAPFAIDPDRSVPMLRNLVGFGFRRMVLPFFEKAELRTPADVAGLARALGQVERKGIDLALETTLRAKELIPVADELRVSVCYDLGNTTALGHDIAADIRALGKRISHVHIKDKRRSDGKNVLLGTGDTDFKGAFRALKDIGYSGDYTMETFRGDDPLETAKRHRRFVEGFIQ